MIIALDGYEANTARRVGIGRYAFEILNHIYQHLNAQSASWRNKLKTENINVCFRIYLPEPPGVHMPEETPWWRYRVAHPRKLWTFIGLPVAISADHPKADLIFSPTHYIPRFVSIRRCMSVMDLSYKSYPELFKPKDLFQLNFWTGYAVAHAEKIFTISEFTKNAIINTYRVPAERIAVTYPGLSVQMTKTVTPKTEIFSKYHISRNFILSVGTLQPRKNFVRLIEAFALFKSENKQRFAGLQLVIAGKKGWLYEEILTAPRKYGIENEVKFLDFVSDSDLPILYKSALCFALPSLYEGFGLPVAEAMSYGCPVVISNVSSLPEIAGKAGIYVDPLSASDISRGLLTAVRQRNLIQGKRRISLGLAQVKKFSWEKAAEQTLSILKEIGEKDNGY